MFGLKIKDGKTKGVVSSKTEKYDLFNIKISSYVVENWEILKDNWQEI